MKTPSAPSLPFGMRWFPVVVIAVLFIAWAVTQIGPTSGTSTDSPAARGTAPVTNRQATSSPSRTTATVAGLPVCADDTLPKQVETTRALIRRGGPFPYPRNDGVVFRNNAELLPEQPRGYYREYTVPTPGASNRGVRRIVTGGRDEDDPTEWFYTDDHYESFCVLLD